MRAMNSMRMMLRKGDLDRLDKAMIVFQEAFKPIQKYMDKFGIRNATEEDVARLRQLELMHHKVMRSIMEKMHHVQEDILVIENAQSQLYHGAELS